MREWLDALENRTKLFAIRVVNLSRRLDKTDVPRSVTWQLIDAGTSVAANHRACRRARSDKEPIAKLGVVVEETDESDFWLEVIQAVTEDATIRKTAKELEQEAEEFTAIFSKSIATTRRRIEARRATRSARKKRIDHYRWGAIEQ